MRSERQDIGKFADFALENPTIHWFAIADSAQDSHVLKALRSRSRNVACLFGATQDTPLACQSPHLVELRPPLHIDDAWDWISRHAPSTSSVSIIATLKEFHLLFDQLAACTQVKMPDSETMFLAFWDPAILGTLLGQLDDLTLHVPGPVLSQAQQSILTEGLAKWWYWDRLGDLHDVAICKQKNLHLSNQLELSQQQVDDLVEASVPDHVLYYVSLNQPHLINDIPPSERYGAVRSAILHARTIGLVGMRDLVDFVSLSMLFKDKMRHDKYIVDLLARVEMGELEFREALGRLP